MIKTAKDRVLRFFEDEIERFLIKDIDVLTKIRPDPSGDGGCTVPLAMFLFAAMDLFGYLIRDDEVSPDKKATRKNLTYLLRKAGLFPGEYSAKSEVIVDLFRHGLMHQVFPKASGIAKWGLDEPLIDASPTPTLNVDVLARDVVRALRELRMRIATAQDDDLAERMNRRLDVLADDDHQKLLDLRAHHKI
jgi:hypothetical protein